MNALYKYMIHDIFSSLIVIVGSMNKSNDFFLKICMGEFIEMKKGL